MKSKFSRAVREARAACGIVYYNNTYGNFFASSKPILNPSLDVIKDFSIPQTHNHEQQQTQQQGN